MGATLQVASEKAGYTLTDIATWAATKDKLELEALVERDPSLLNIYHVIGVNPAKWPKVNAAGAKAFSDYIVSPEGQEMIGAFGRTPSACSCSSPMPGSPRTASPRRDPGMAAEPMETADVIPGTT